jgi:23S rRNA (cytosine1962-C5)-methyltransferase
MGRTDRRRPATGPSAGIAADHGCIELPAFLESELRTGHPWVYRNHVPTQFEATTGSWVCAQVGRLRLWALWDDESPIALRVFSREQQPTADLIRRIVEEAVHCRQTLKPAHTTAYRAINGEGDGLPAIVVDVYGPYAVIATYSSATQTVLPWVVDALDHVLSPRGILHKRVAGEPNQASKPELLQGEAPPRDLVVTECGIRFYADILQGHKTGLYLDQRDNRQTFARFASSGAVLNLFSYTGGFSLAASLAGGAVTTNVDGSQPALERARDNFRINDVDSSAHEFTVADCYDYLSQASRSQARFDAIICDPPSLARNRAQLDHALTAYARLNSLGLRLVRPGGYYAAASCTAQVTPESFRHTLAIAAQRAGVSAQIVHEAGHAFDHPVNLGHPEGRYLKFLVLRVFDCKRR